MRQTPPARGRWHEVPEGERRLREARTEGETFPLALTKDLGSLPHPLRGTAYAARPLCRFATSPRSVGSHPPRGAAQTAFCPLYTRGPFYFPQKIQKNFPLPATILTHPSFITIEASEILPCKASEKTHKFPCECREFLGVFLSCFRRVSRRIMLYHRIRGKAFVLRCSKGVFYAQLVCA